MIFGTVSRLPVWSLERQNGGTLTKVFWTNPLPNVRMEKIAVRRTLTPIISICIYKNYSLKIPWTIVSWPLQRTATAMLGTITNIGGTGIMMNLIAW